VCVTPPPASQSAYAGNSNALEPASKRRETQGALTLKTFGTAKFLCRHRHEYEMITDRFETALVATLQELENLRPFS